MEEVLERIVHRVAERAVKIEIMLAATVAKRTLQLRAAVFAVRVHRRMVAVDPGGVGCDLVRDDSGFDRNRRRGKIRRFGVGRHGGGQVWGARRGCRRR